MTWVPWGYWTREPGWSIYAWPGIPAPPLQSESPVLDLAPGWFHKVHPVPKCHPAWAASSRRISAWLSIGSALVRHLLKPSLGQHWQHICCSLAAASPWLTWTSESAKHRWLRRLRRVFWVPARRRQWDRDIGKRWGWPGKHGKLPAATTALGWIG